MACALRGRRWERTWEATLRRAVAMPAGTLDASVGGEWSFAQTLRHLVMATDTWLGKSILEPDQPYHPAGMPNDDHQTDAFDESVLSTQTPAFEEVVEARAERQTMVRDHLATVTPEDLARPRENPPAPAHPETVLPACARSSRRSGSTTATPT